MLAASLLHSSVEHLSLTLANSTFFLVNGMDIWMEILNLSTLPSHQETAKLYTFLLACSSKGEAFQT